MLPTPSTVHVDFDRIYEPAEDSFLLLDTLSSEREKAFLSQRFRIRNGTGDDGRNGRMDTASPLVVEIGTGSGVVLSFATAHANVIFGREDVLTLGTDANVYACQATEKTATVATVGQKEQSETCGHYLGNVVGDLATSLRAGLVDVLIFNPPYVPTPDLPTLPAHSRTTAGKTSYEDDSHLLSLSYAGGADGMETTYRLIDELPNILSSRGVAYILLCAQNKPDIFKQHIKEWGSPWSVEAVGSSGKTAGWEKLQIMRIWRTTESDTI